MTESKNVGLFLLLPAPLNPIGAFDAESFKAIFRTAMAENDEVKFIEKIEELLKKILLIYYKEKKK